MASKSKLERIRTEQRQEFWQRNNSRFAGVLGLSILVATLVFAYMGSGFASKEKVVEIIQNDSPFLMLKPGMTAEKEEARAKKRFESEVSVLLGDNDVSRQFPKILRERLQAMLGLDKAGKLMFEAVTQVQGYAIMGCSCDTRDIPKIGIFVPWFNDFADKQEPALFRTLFAISLYHELVHLERWPVDRKQTAEENLDEEIRAYHKTSLDIVRPLREKGFTIPTNFWDIDETLQKCGDSPECPDFRRKIQKYVDSTAASVKD